MITIYRYFKSTVSINLKGKLAKKKTVMNMKSRIRGVIKGLGFSTDESSQNIGELSGGQKTRVALGKLLLSAPDLLLFR